MELTLTAGRACAAGAAVARACPNAGISIEPVAGRACAVAVARAGDAVAVARAGVACALTATGALPVWVVWQYGWAVATAAVAVVEVDERAYAHEEDVAPASSEVGTSVTPCLRHSSR